MSQAELTIETARSGRIREGTVGCLLLIAANGIAIAVLPHVVRFQQVGDSAYVADPDDLIYVANGARAFYGEAIGNTDLPTGHPPGMLPFVGTVPFLHLARMFSDRPISVLFVWRFWAGLSMSFGLFVLMKSFFQSRWPALMTALLLPCDAGWLSCRPGVQNVLMSIQYWTHPDAQITRGTNVHWQLRVVSPATLMVWLLVYFWLLGRARETGRPLWIVLAGTSLGLLCDAYFFFATTAALGLCLLTLVDWKHRATYVKVGLLSALVACPIMFNIWQARGAMVPEAINRLGIAADLSAGISLPRMAMVSLVISGIAMVWKRRELAPLWCFAVAGLFLYNSHVITGIDFQHGHWRAYALMPVASLLLLIVGFDVLTRIKPQWLLRTGVTIAFVVSMSAGYYLRLEAAVRPHASTRSDNAFHARETAEKITPWSTVAGPGRFVTYAAVSHPVIPLYDAIVFHSSFIGESELSERRALNEILMGTESEDYEKLIVAHLDTYPFGDAAQDPEARQRMMSTYVDAYKQTRLAFGSRMRQYDVRFLVLSSGRQPPEIVRPFCKEVSMSEHWTMFEIDLEALETSGQQVSDPT